MISKNNSLRNSKISSIPNPKQRGNQNIFLFLKKSKIRVIQYFMIKVSIITPSFNQASFLEECIKSVLNQDYPNIEYIIIDGGSTDGSIDIIKKYNDKLTYWISEPDNGQSHAINKGFKKATGDIVAWLNSDDLYFPDAVSTAVKRFEEIPDLTLFYGDCVFIDKNGSFIRYFTEVEPYNQDRLLNFSDYIMQPTAFFSREKLVEVGYLDESFHYVMDWDLWCKLCKVGQVFYENKLIAANRDYETTKTNTGGIERLKEIWALQNKHKTNFYHNAFLNYLAAEIRTTFEKSNIKAIRFSGKYLALLTLCLSPKNIIYSKENDHKRGLYGFKPNSLIIPQGKAEIHLPQIWQEIIFVFKESLNEEQKHIFINKTPVNENFIKIENDYSSTQNLQKSILIEIKDQTGNYCKGEIEKINTLYQL